jgi:hypothetical protein
MAQRTGILPQWGNIEKEIKEYVKYKTADALWQIGQDAMKFVDISKSFNNDTYNLADSTGFAVYHKAKLIKHLRGNFSVYKYGRMRMAQKPYKIKSDKEITTRYGETFQYVKGQTLNGRDLFEQATERYKSVTSGGYVMYAEMVLFSEMFYRYFLEEKGMLNSLIMIENYIVNNATASLRRYYGSKRTYSPMPITVKPKNFRVDEESEE